MTRDVSTVSRVKKMGYRGIWKKGLKEGGESGTREMENGEDSHNIVYTVADIQIWERGGIEDDGDQGRWTVKKSHVCSPEFQGTHALRGYTVGKTLRADRHRHRD